MAEQPIDIAQQVVTVPTQGEQENAIANFDILIQGVSIKIRELVQGYGGLTALNRFLIQVPYISNMEKLSEVIQNNMIKWQRALNMADPELAKKHAMPMTVRKYRVSQFLGPQVFYDVSMELFNLGKDPMPETVVVWRGFQWLGEAYVAGYDAVNKLFTNIADYMGKEQFKIQDTSFLRYLELSRLEYIKGETRISVPEKGMLEFLVYGNLAGVPIETAKGLIFAGVDLLRLGYITELLDGSFSDLFEKASERFFALYKKQLSAILPTATEALGFVTTPDMQYNLVQQEHYSYPLLLAEHGSWSTGQLVGKMVLETFQAPLYVAEESNVTGILSVPGKGKTALMNALACASIFDRGYAVFTPMNDDTNQPTLCCMPMFSYDRRTQRLTDILRQRLQLEPNPVPLICLNIVTPTDFDELKAQPLTVFDRIIKLPDTRRFSLDFSAVIAELDESREILQSQGYGPYRPHSGMICVRNLDRLDLRNRTNMELQIAYNMLHDYDRWRESHREQPCRIQIDEIADFAPSRAQLAGSDQIVMGATIERFIRRARRKNTPMDWSSQRTTETILPLKDMTTSILFRDLPQSPRKEQSQIDYLLDLIQLEDRAIKDAVLELNRKNAFRGTFLWFWYHRPTRQVNVVASLPPTWMLEDKQVNTKDLMLKYQAHTGHHILVDRVDQVKDISYVAQTPAMGGGDNTRNRNPSPADAFVRRGPGRPRAAPPDENIEGL